MKTTFNIHNKQKESLSHATVILRISGKEEYKLAYDTELGVFAMDLEPQERKRRTAKRRDGESQGTEQKQVKKGFLATVMVSCEGYEPVTFKQRLTENETEVCLGETGTKYARAGNSMRPVKEHLDVIGVGWCTEEGIAALKEQGLEPLLEYKGRKLERRMFFRFTSDKTQGKSKSQLKQMRKDVLRKLKNHKGLQYLGKVENLEEGGRIDSRQIVLKPVSGVSESNIRKVVLQLGLQVAGRTGKNILVNIPENTPYDRVELIEKLYETGYFEMVESSGIASVHGNAVNPPGAMWKGDYTHHEMNVKAAWELLQGKNNNIAYGDGDIIVGVMDSGIAQSAGTVPAFTGDVTKLNGDVVPKLHDIYDFINGQPHNNLNAGGSTNTNAHGTEVAGIVSARVDGTVPAVDNGTLGVAPNTRLISTIVLGNFVNMSAMVRWMAGLEAYNISGITRPKLDEGMDVLVSSQFVEITDIGQEAFFNTTIQELTQDLLHLGRKGRGTLMVFSAGNESIHIQLIPGTLPSVAVQPDIITIGSVSRYPDNAFDDYTNGLRKSVYSNTGKIDFCAPSDNGASGLSEHDPARGYRSWTSTIVGKGNIIGDIAETQSGTNTFPEPYPIKDSNAQITNTFNRAKPFCQAKVTTPLVPAVLPALTTINVDNSTHFVAGATAVITGKDATNNSISQEFIINSVGGNTLTVSASTPLVNTYSSDTMVFGGAIVPKTKLSAAEAIGSSNLNVDSDDGFKDDMIIFLISGTSGTNPGLYKIDGNPAGNILHTSAGVTTAYNATDTHQVIGLTTIKYGTGISYQNREMVLVEYIAQGNTYFHVCNIVFVNSGTEELYVEGIPYNHQIEGITDITIRSLNYGVVFPGSTFYGPLPANYNPTTTVTTNVAVNDVEIHITPADVANFVDGTLVKIESNGNVEWRRIISKTATSLKFDPADKCTFSHTVANLPVITAYPTLRPSANSSTMNVNDYVKINHSTHNSIYGRLIHKHALSEFWALTPNQIANTVATANWGAVLRLPALTVASTAGFADKDKVLLGDPEYDEITRTEVSEMTEVDKVFDSTTLLLSSIRKAHPVAPKVRKGAMNYSYFSGTSSACPSAGGVIALVLSANPELTWSETVEILHSTAVKVDPNNRGYHGTASDTTGYESDKGNIITFSPSDADPTIRPVREGQWKNKAGNYVFQANGTSPTPSLPDYVPYKSDWYGHGMLDAEAAVQAALDYNKDYVQRDLVIRDSLADEGQVASSLALDINSPDVWVRNIPPFGTSGAGVTDPDYSTTLTHASAGPHQEPLKNSKRYIYARISNFGIDFANLDAKVRFYVVLSNPGTQLKFPDHFDKTGNVAAGTAGVELIGEVTLNAGAIPKSIGTHSAGTMSYTTISSKIVQIEWPIDTVEEDTSLETTILVEVTPHDGKFLGPNGEGDLIAYNNNLTRKKVVFRDEIHIRGTGQALPGVISIPSDALATSVTTNFEVSITDLDPFTTELTKVRVTLEKFGTSEVVTYRYDSGAWGYDVAPTGAWLTLNPPLIEPFGSGNLASGSVSDLLFKGSFSVNGTDNYVKIEAFYTDVTAGEISAQKTIDVAVQYLPNPATFDDPVEKNVAYFFTEFDHLNPQVNQNDAFGPDSTTPQTTFHITSKHPVNGSATPKAFAVVSGQIMVLQTANPNLVNVVLKPRNQGSIDFLDVKYFVYRGILKSDLVDGTNDELVAPTGTNAFIHSIWETQASINTAIENADPSDSINTGDVTDKPSTRALGYHFVPVATQPWHTVKLDSDVIDGLFFDNVSEFKFPIINAGEEFGKFDTNNVGFEIILNGDPTTFGEIRAADKTVVVPALSGTPSDLDKLNDRKNRSKVLKYFDPAAFYGVHIYTGIHAIDMNGNEEIYKKDPAYDTLIDLFKNKNRTYIDIRNENGYTFNYYDNYTDGSGFDIKLSFDSNVSPNPQVFGTNSWPLRIVENGELETGNNESKNAVRIGFPKGDNLEPLVYKEFGSLYGSFPKLPKQKKKFEKLVFNVGDLYSEELKFGLPNRSGLSATTAIAWYVKLRYVRRNDEANATSNIMVPNGTHHLDHIFRIKDVLPWDVAANIKFATTDHKRYLQRGDFAFIGESGMSRGSSRVSFFTTPEDVFFSSGKKMQFYKRIMGGTSNKDSFFQVLESVFPDMKIQQKTLTISGTPKNCLVYNDPGIFGDAETSKRNLFCVNMTDAEFNGLLASASSVSLDESLHDFTLKVDAVSVSTDDDGQAYQKYDLKITGLDTNGAYTIAPTVVEAYSLDGIMLSTHDFAFQETGNFVEEDCIQFKGDALAADATTSFGHVIKRLSVFTDILDVEVRKWKLYTAAGIPITYGAGETTNFGDPISVGDPIELPVGTRVVMIDCRQLPVATSDNWGYVKVVTWYNGDYREGYVSELAFMNSTIERVLSTDSITDQEIIEAVVNDIRFDVVMARNIVNDPTRAGHDPNTTYLNLLDNLENEMDPNGLLPIVKEYLEAPGFKIQSWAGMIRNNAQQIGFNYDTYLDGQTTRIDSVSTIEKYNQIIDDVIPLDLSGLPVGRPVSLVVPFNVYWLGHPGNLIQGYNEKITEFTGKYCSELAQNMFGPSGTSTNYPDDEYTTHNAELKKLRSFLQGTNFDGLQLASDDPILNTPEAKWMLKQEHSADMNGDSSNIDFYDTIGDIVLVWNETWYNERNRIGRFADFRRGYVGVDCSMGFVNSSNVLAMMLHEFNDGDSHLLNLADNTHFNPTNVPSDTGGFDGKYVSQNAWEYVKENGFSAFQSHGFYPTASYTDGNGHTLASTYGAQKNIADFFQRNPSLGIVFAQHIINKLKGI